VSVVLEAATAKGGGPVVGNRSVEPPEIGQELAHHPLTLGIGWTLRPGPCQEPGGDLRRELAKPFLSASILTTTRGL
jgi:hypothetical protein